MIRGTLRTAKGALSIALALLGVVSPGSAATSIACFRPVEIEAEQAVRYQTELMVVSDTCGASIYRRFTVRNRDAIVTYQHLMIEHFRRLGARSAEAAFDTYQTRLANEQALNSGREPVVSLCRQSAGFLAEADGLDREQFRHVIAARAAKQSSGYKRCRD